MFFLKDTIPDPVAFAIFGFPIMWYGVLIGVGILIAVLIMYKRAESHGISPDRVIDLLIISIPVGVIGARVYYVAFNWESYSGDFLKMINFRLGGLAIHGGLIFGLLAALILCRLWKIDVLSLFDLAAPSIAIAQSIGRWGNYFNSEAHGGPTNLPWAIPVDGQMVHPTFLYESIWCLLLFFLLLYLDKKRKFAGQIFLLYGILYSLERVFVETLRTDSLMFFGLKQAQVFSASVIVICLLAYFYLSKRQSAKTI